MASDIDMHEDVPIMGMAPGYVRDMDVFLNGDDEPLTDAQYVEVTRAVCESLYDCLDDDVKTRIDDEADSLIARHLRIARGESVPAAGKEDGAVSRYLKSVGITFTDSFQGAGDTNGDADDDAVEPTSDSDSETREQDIEEYGVAHDFPDEEE